MTERAEAMQCAERRTAHCGLGIVEAGASRVRVAHVAGERDDAPALGRRGRQEGNAALRHDQFFNRSDSVVTTHETANANTIAMIAPLSTVRNVVLPSAQNRRQIGVRRYAGAASSVTAIPPRGARRPRCNRGVGLARFRQPTDSSASMARPTIHAARVVKSVTDTQQLMVVRTPVEAVAPNPVHKRWAYPLIGISFLVLAAIVLATVFTASRFGAIKRPYARVPSDAEQVESRIQFDGVDRYPADGKFLFVTIRNPQLSLLSWFMFRKDHDIVPLRYTDVYPNVTPAQQQVRGQRQMIGAQQAAEYAALSKLGYPIELVPGEIVVDQLVCLKVNEAGTACAQEAPSSKVLQPDDELVRVDGVDIKVVDDLTPILKAHKPGDTIEVQYKRAGIDALQTGTIELIASPDDPSRTIIGFIPLDTTRVGTAPFDIGYSTEGIGGPSAGLAFTLTIIDELTPGELTGDRTVAVTGTIDIKGNVGAIGGLPQKASAVMQTGAKYFLVPASQSDADIAQARANVNGKVEIIPVATLDEALAALAKLGGNADEIGTPGKDFQPPS